MPKCRNCDNEVDSSFGYCPKCGASIDKPTADLEHQVRAFLDDGQKIAAVKLYKDQTGVGLAEAKEAVEALQADTGPPSSSDIGGDLEAELLRLLGRGDKLEAVKRYKDQKGVALIEAKQAVESLAARHGLETQRGGCLGVVAVVVLAAVAFGMTICFAGNVAPHDVVPIGSRDVRARLHQVHASKGGEPAAGEIAHETCPSLKQKRPQRQRCKTIIPAESGQGNCGQGIR